MNPKRDHIPTSLFNHLKIATVRVIQIKTVKRHLTMSILVSRGIHSDGWQMLGANNWVESHRLQKFGWDPVETKKNDFFTTLEQSVDVVLE